MLSLSVSVPACSASKSGLFMCRPQRCSIFGALQRLWGGILASITKAIIHMFVRELNVCVHFQDLMILHEVVWTCLCE